MIFEVTRHIFQHANYKIMNTRFPLLFLLTLLLLSCGVQNNPSSGGESTVVTGDDDNDYVDNQTWNSTISVVWNASAATVTGTVDGVTVTNTDGYVTITSTAKHVQYELSGSGQGQLKIYSDYKIKLSLANLTLTCTDGPAINNQCSKSCYLVLSGANTLTDTNGYSTEVGSGTEAEDQKGAFFSEGQVLISGDGSLKITGNNKHALASDDYIRVFSGTLQLTSNVSDGLHTNDGVIIDGGTLTINAVDEGVQVDEGTFYMTNGALSVTTTGTKAKGVKSEGDMLIEGGTINVTTPGRESEGIESKAILTISGGTVNVVAYDDAINAGSHLYIKGGSVTAVSTGNDALDSNGNMYIEGGTTIACGASSPECGIDANEEQRYSVYFTGGTLLAVGGGNSTPSSSESTQAYVSTSASVSANTTVSLLSGSTTLCSFTIPSTYAGRSQGGGMGYGGGSNLLITCPDLVKSQSYTVQVGSNTTSATAQQYGSSSGMGGGGNGGGHGGGGWH